MLLARVKGNIISTQKNDYLVGHKLLLVHKIDLAGNYIGDKDIIAIDLIDSGIGDTVLITQEGDAVQQVLGHKKSPLNTMIIANVDDIDV
ncbi:MAG: EutN/CcmL family microcompartment protein [Clostridiales bacterium]